MSLPQVVSREQWLVARKQFLAREKELTRARDALNADRRRLPMVEIEKAYVFEGPGGKVTLADLFDGCRQLVVQHVMFDPAWDAACKGCTASIDELSEGLLTHLRSRDTNFVLISRTPLAKIEDYRALRRWPYRWYSSYGSDFNYDFHVSLDQSVAPVEYNYRGAEELKQAGMDWLLEGPSEQPGVSCFLTDEGRIFHTYSTFARGSEQLGGSYGVLDMTALGRQEAWEEPKGRVEKPHGADPTFTD
ncbi:MAG TPA: DUF899 domain-containing protein [Actinocrinis sp.]|jgi:predicted dithiol-disulfide oxidoreductase (DUF899 family)|uniref:DUF899 domain-containing protein n=1 Tax=Actinocrinis sp. TaxID=1920516 RepID=UPI002DDD19E2|nr:DUF899 domain-containing protein [Actinocrinis sp.]HEV3173041.1 DUF899 domain-containing protein [Actinocrinis sp.]